MAALGYRICVASLPGSEQIVDGALTIGFLLMKALCGPHWQPIETSLTRHRPVDVRPYRAQFGEAVRFDAEVSALFFGAYWLDVPVHGADPELERILLRMIRGAEATHERDLRDEIRRVLAGMIGHGAINRETVAHAFGLSSRTLHRRLAALGTSFQAVLDELRCNIACRMLEDTALSIGQVAPLLDYREASAFTRSFKRRQGCSPAAWRAAHAASAPDALHHLR